MCFWRSCYPQQTCAARCYIYRDHEGEKRRDALDLSGPFMSTYLAPGMSVVGSVEDRCFRQGHDEARRSSVECIKKTENGK